MPPLHMRQEFPTLKAFKEALHAWAIEAHFEPRILKSDTGRVRVGCKRDPSCPFVIRCNWERKNGREPLARVTVLREKHTCLNGLEWRNASIGVGGGEGQIGQGMHMMAGPPPGGMVSGMGMNGNLNGNLNGGMGNGMSVGVNGMSQMGGAPVVPSLEIRQDEDGNIVGGARILGPVDPRPMGDGQIVPVLPKVQRNSASRLPFLMEILPRLMQISKETTPSEIRECLLREFGAEVHLQQCRRAKTEILKKRLIGEDTCADADANGEPDEPMRQPQGLDSMGGSEHQDGSQHNMFSNGQDMNGGVGMNGDGDYGIHTASGVVIPQVPNRRNDPVLNVNVNANANAVGEQPVRCPYCINLRWMKSIKDAVEHMSMHVVV